MGEEPRDRQQRRRIAGTCRSVSAEPPTSIYDVPDDLLELILLRVRTPVSLIRAAATCKAWRRVIAGDGFLRRFHRLSGPHILGHYYCYWEGCRPAFVPLAVPAERKPAIDTSHRVSLDFLPIKYSCSMRPVLQDSRGGLLAFSCSSSRIIACSPWTRQHTEIYLPCPSGMPGAEKGNTTVQCLGVFLLDADPGEMERGMGLNMSNFRLVSVRLIRYCHNDNKVVQACVFSAKDNRWLSSSIVITSDILPGHGILSVPFVFVGRAGGSICWFIKGQCSNVVFHLNENTVEFSYLRLPEINSYTVYYNKRNLRVIGTAHLARIVRNDLEVLRYDAHGGGACVVERRIDLSHQMAGNVWSSVRHDPQWYFLDSTPDAAAPGCIVMCYDECCVEYIWRFSVDTQNMTQDRAQKLESGDARVFYYELPWPPSMNACLVCDDAMQEEANNS